MHRGKYVFEIRKPENVSAIDRFGYPVVLDLALPYVPEDVHIVVV
jgi:hypothetical protein